MSGVGIGAGAWINLNPLNSGQIMRGIVSMANNTDTFNVTGLSIGTTSYVLILTISNLVDGTPRHLDPNTTAKTATGFTFQTAQKTDSANYRCEYVIIKL